MSTLVSPTCIKPSPTPGLGFKSSPMHSLFTTVVIIVHDTVANSILYLIFLLLASTIHIFLYGSPKFAK